MRGSAYNGGPGYPVTTAKNWELMAVHASQENQNKP